MSVQQSAVEQTRRVVALAGHEMSVVRQGPGIVERGPRHGYAAVAQGIDIEARVRMLVHRLQAGEAWRYAVFARDGDGPWVLWRDEVVSLP